MWNTNFLKETGISITQTKLNHQQVQIEYARERRSKNVSPPDRIDYLKQPTHKLPYYMNADVVGPSTR
jgi:hypothetical protein